MAFSFDTTRTTGAAAQVPGGNSNFSTLKTAFNTLGAAWATYANAESLSTPVYLEGEDRIVRALAYAASESTDKSS